MNILFTCGGTAGHVNPAVALARIFQEREPGCRVLFVGADGGMETRLVPKEGYPIETVRISFRVLWSWVASAASVAASETEESEDEPAVSAVAVSSIISASPS